MVDHQVDLWCSFLDELNDERLEGSYRALLSSEEAQRYARYQSEQDRRQFLLTRALVRDVLARYVGVEPAALVFARNAHGKPVLVEPARCPVTFSLSHTGDLSVCAVARAGMLGVDVESLSRTVSDAELARRFFSPDEVRDLETLEGSQKRAGFIRLWTLKEAYIKARGLGLALPLHQFSIRCAPRQPPRVSGTDGTPGTEGDWQFLQLRLRNSFHLAVALSVPERASVAVQLSKLIPLTGQLTSVLLEPNALNAWALDEL